MHKIRAIREQQKEEEEEKEMKQIVQRILTIVLSAAMVLTMVPTTAFAEVNENLMGSDPNVDHAKISCVVSALFRKENR